MKFKGAHTAPLLTTYPCQQCTSQTARVSSAAHKPPVSAVQLTTCPCQQCKTHILNMGPADLDLTCRVVVKGASTALSPTSLKLRCALT